MVVNISMLHIKYRHVMINANIVSDLHLLINK